MEYEGTSDINRELSRMLHTYIICSYISTRSRPEIVTTYSL